MGYYNHLQRPYTVNGGISSLAAEEKLNTVSGISRPLQGAMVIIPRKRNSIKGNANLDRGLYNNRHLI
jgi:hypothetical protein